MGAFEAVTIAVTAIGTIVAVITFLRTGALLEGLGRSGQLWIDHERDMPIAEQPSEDGPDLPLPRRRLRGRAAA